MKALSSKQLRQIYGEPLPRTVQKEMPQLDVHCRNFIERSPFMLLSTFGHEGKVDVSPKGGAPGFVHIANDRQLLIPDSRGNNRIDSLINIAETGRAGCLFLIPGMDEALRVNGSALVSDSSELLALFPEGKNPPKTVIVIETEEVFLHCAKALMRSELWNPDRHMDRSEMPSMGQMLKDQIGHNDPAETREQMLKRYEDLM